MTIFDLEQFDPCPLARSGALDKATPGRSDVLALNIESKYQFVDERGDIIHEYPVPGTSDVQNCGGYVDKVIQYRDPVLLAYLVKHGVSKESFLSGQFPLLRTRSPLLDLLLFETIRTLRRQDSSARVSLLDHGCTVAEHFDLLDVMLQAASNGRDRASETLQYFGLDRSIMLLTAARLLHFDVPEKHFQLLRAEGSDFSLSPASFDMGLSVGVVNHVANPRAAFDKILAATRHVAVFALWVTADQDGFWAINHSGVSSYFFSQSDLAAALQRRGEGKFYSAGYTPEASSTQQRSYIGLGEEKLEKLGCYHLVYSTMPRLPFDADEITL